MSIELFESWHFDAEENCFLLRKDSGFRINEYLAVVYNPRRDIHQLIHTKTKFEIGSFYCLGRLFLFLESLSDSDRRFIAALKTQYHPCGRPYVPEAASPRGSEFKKKWEDVFLHDWSLFGFLGDEDSDTY